VVASLLFLYIIIFELNFLGGRMAVFNSLDEAREYFKGDKFATGSGMVIDDLTEEYSVCSVDVTDKLANANGGVMGGALFTLADFAFAALVNNIHKPTVAQQVSVNYLSAPKGKKLIATAKLKKNGRTSTIVNVDVVDDTGRDVLQFIGVGFKL